jgi:hypothetical protein
MGSTLDLKILETRDALVGERDPFSVSEIYHENSRITAAAPGMAISREVVRVAPSGFKHYQHAACTPLPEPALGDGGLGEVVTGRRSCRDYCGDPLRLADLPTCCS